MQRMLCRNDNRNRVWLITTSFLLSATFNSAAWAVPSAQPQAITATQHVIQASYDRSSAGIARKNVAVALSHDRTDYRYTKLNGQVNDLKYIRHNLAHIFSQVRTIKEHMTIVSFFMKGLTATVKVRTDTVASVGPENTQQAHNLEQRKLVEDVWRKSGGKWWMVSSKELSEQSTIDGHTVHLHSPASSHHRT